MKKDLTNTPIVEVKSGCFAQFIHGEGVTIALWEIKKGAIIPEHSHVHEQVSLILDGELEFTINGITEVYSAGQYVVIPSNVIHSAIGFSDCKAYDVFCPVRDDYKF